MSFIVKTLQGIRSNSREWPSPSSEARPLRRAPRLQCRTSHTVSFQDVSIRRDDRSSPQTDRPYWLQTVPTSPQRGSFSFDWRGYSPYSGYYQQVAIDYTTLTIHNKSYPSQPRWSELFWRSGVSCAGHMYRREQKLEGGGDTDGDSDYQTDIYKRSRR